MTKQIGIKLEPKLLEQFKSFAKDHGTTVSALMRQATIEYVRRRISGIYTQSQQQEEQPQ